MLTEEELKKLKRFVKDLRGPDEIGDGTYVKTGLKKGDMVVLKIMTDAPDMEISTLTGSNASQAYQDARQRDQDATRKRDSGLADRVIHVSALSSEMEPPINARRDRLGIALEDSIHIVNDPDGLHEVRVLLDSWSE